MVGNHRLTMGVMLDQYVRLIGDGMEVNIADLTWSSLVKLIIYSARAGI